jgi:hypothetical protein
MWPLAAYTGGRRRAPTASGGSNPIPATIGPAICRAFLFSRGFSGRALRARLDYAIFRLGRSNSIHQRR